MHRRKNEMTSIDIFYRIFENSEFAGCVFGDKDGPWLRWDIDDYNSKEQNDEYYLLVDRLKDFGVVLRDPLVEHDCISGFLSIKKIIQDSQTLYP